MGRGLVGGIGGDVAGSLVQPYLLQMRMSEDGMAKPLSPGISLCRICDTLFVVCANARVCDLSVYVYIVDVSTGGMYVLCGAVAGVPSVVCDCVCVCLPCVVTVLRASWPMRDA
jgi:hypothetical protein